MKLVTFQSDGGARLGVLSEDGSQVVELSEPHDMRSLIERGERGLEQVRETKARSRGREHDLDRLRLLAPLPNPNGNVIAIGRNYEKHAAETARAEGREPSPPTIFTKAISSLTEPDADIAIDPAISVNIDWEVELAVVIGRAGANIKRESARPHVFGYTVLNDITARDMQSGWGGQYFKGKSLDRSCPTGPWIVTADEIPDPQSLALKLRVNGQTKQDGRTRDMIYAVDALVEWVSRGMTLPIASIIATGTPDGVGFARKPPEFLRPGDVMETEVEGIGVLHNRIIGVPND
jgi:2-keto-4-pentenoate hydratase/2-oxohepta-3-ene-1,7-dioic acid hydratase in catechol pathway